MSIQGYRKVLAMAGLALAAMPGTAAQAQDLSPETIWQEQYRGLRDSICPAPEHVGMSYAEMSDTARHAIEPVQVFDNLYMLGMSTISAWALTTPDGIILFDAMQHHNVEQTIEQGLVRLGLDPADIKYVVISHAHNDHFGGARYLQEKYGAIVVMMEADWSHIHTWPQLGPPAPYPLHDMAVRDGSTLTLGGTTVRFVATPGHTPGTLSPIFPVQDGEETHHVGYWGASAVSFLEPVGIAQYMASADYFMRIDPRVDVALTNHPGIDASLLRVQALARREAGDAHPFVIGNDGFRQWMQAIHDCAGEVLDGKIAATSGE